MLQANKVLRQDEIVQFTKRNLPDESLKFVCLFVALRPKSTAMVIAGRSVHLTTPFPGQA